MTTPQDDAPREGGTDHVSDDDALRSVMDGDQAPSRQARRTRRDPVSPTAQARLRSGDAVIGDTLNVPRPGARRPRPAPVPPPVETDRTDVVIGSVSPHGPRESRRGEATPRVTVAPETPDAVPSSTPVEADEPAAAAPSPVVETSSEGSSLAEGLARTGPSTSEIRAVEAQSPWARLNAPDVDPGLSGATFGTTPTDLRADGSPPPAAAQVRPSGVGQVERSGRSVLFLVLAGLLLAALVVLLVLILF